MAEIVLGLGTSHSPLLSVPAEMWRPYAERDRANATLYRIPDGKHVDYEELLAAADPAIEKELTDEVFRARHEANQKGIEWVGRKLEEVAPDVLVMLGDDQSETFNREAMPAMAVFWQDEVPFKRRDSRPQDEIMAWARELYGSEEMTFPVDAGLGRRIVESVSSENFDVMHVRKLAENQTMSHAFGFVWRRLMPSKVIPTVPIHINTYFPPNQPTPERCLEFGRAVGRAIESWDSSARVAVLASGGFSHFVVDEEIDQRVMKAMQNKDDEAIASLPLERLQSGTSEIRNWIATAGAVEHLTMKVNDYVPCYRSLAGTGCAMAFAAWE